MFQVIKRDGQIVEFQLDKINEALRKAFEAKEKQYGDDILGLLGLRVTADFQDTVRTCPSALLASLPVKISQNNSTPKTLNRHKTNIRSKSELSKNTSICNNLLSKRILYHINEFCN